MTQETQVQSLFETNESTQSALKSNNASKSVLDLGASSTKNGKFFGKNDEQILSHDLCQNSQSILGSSLKANNNFQNTTNSNQNLNNTTQNALNASDETNANFKNTLNANTEKPNNDIDTEKSELDLSENSQMPLKSNSHSSDKAKSALTSAHISHNTINTNANKDFAPSLNKDFELNSNKKLSFTTLMDLKNNEIVNLSKELEQERVFHQKQGRVFEPMLQYNKQPFSVLIFPDFTAFDFNLFMCFCFAAKEKGSAKIRLTYSDLNFLMGRFDNEIKQQSVIERNLKRLFNKFEFFIEKAMKTIIKVSESDGKYSTNTYTGFFDFIKNFEKERCIIIKFNEFMVSALNGFKFTHFYTKFELKQYCKLQSKYSKQLYILLMDNFYTKKNLIIKKDELVRHFHISKSLAREDNFKKNVLEIIKKDLEKHTYKTFVYKRIIGKNNKTLGYEFIYG